MNRFTLLMARLLGEKAQGIELPMVDGSGGPTARTSGYKWRGRYYITVIHLNNAETSSRRTEGK